MKRLKVFPIGAFFRTAGIIMGVLLLLVVIPVGVIRTLNQTLPVLGGVLVILIMASAGPLCLIMGLYYRVELSEHEMKVKALITLGTLDIQSIRRFERVVEFMPMYAVVVQQGLTATTVKYLLGLRHEIEFMVALKERNYGIQFSPRNEKRIAQLMEKS